MTKSTAEDRILERIKGGSSSPLFLVAGESVLAESSGQRIAAALASPLGARVETYRRPADLREIFADLRTFSLFGSAKVILVIESAVLSDRSAAAYLIDQAAEALTFEKYEDWRGSERRERNIRNLHYLLSTGRPIYFDYLEGRTTRRPY